MPSFLSRSDDKSLSCLFFDYDTPPAAALDLHQAAVDLRKAAKWFLSPGCGSSI